DIGIDGFNGVVFQQIVNRKEHWNGKGIGQPVNMRRLSLKKQFEIARVVGLEDPFDNVYEISMEDIPSKKCVVKEKTRRKEKEYISDIRSVNRNIVNNE
ncbi:32595_t:CDS:1, partial [Racocetra persica]